jgi:hypothetical protein
MPKVIIVIREPGRLNSDYSLEFDLPQVPQKGDYISIQRPDKPRPYGEDVIVEQVWWRLDHPETATVGSAVPKIGGVIEIFVECSPAVGPYSSDQWRDSLRGALERGDAKRFDVARLSVRQDEIKPG